MNKVLFICLVSLSICFSSPTGKEEKPAPVTVAAVTTVSATEQKPQPPITEPAKTPEHGIAVPSNTTAPAVNPTTSPAVPPTHNETSTAKNDTAAPIVDNKTGNKTEKPDEKKPVPATEKPTSTVAPTKPEDKKKSETTTEKPTPLKPTPAAATDDKHDVVLQSRSFDGPSFIGGIILALGMLAVGFIGFRYYKSQAERNYHTL